MPGKPVSESPERDLELGGAMMIEMVTEVLLSWLTSSQRARGSRPAIVAHVSWKLCEVGHIRRECPATRPEPVLPSFPQRAFSRWWTQRTRRIRYREHLAVQFISPGGAEFFRRAAISRARGRREILFRTLKMSIKNSSIISIAWARYQEVTTR